MARRSGKDGAATLGGVTFKVTNWEYTPRSINTEIPAAGDTGTARVHLRDDWEARIEGVMDAGSFPDVTALVGTSAALALADGGGDIAIAKNGLVSEAPITSPIDGGIKISATIVCDDPTDTAAI